MPELIADKSCLLLDGREFRMVSGGMHYFRIPRAYWRDRLEKLLAMGCNTLETYVPWVLHEPRPGRFDYSGNLDIAAFVKIAGELGLNVIVRPGPYICGEFEFGGLPWWLLKDRTMRVRTRHPGFLAATSAYFESLMGELMPHQSVSGGPIVAYQVENEYGYFGNDREYLLLVREALVRAGAEGLFLTSDGPFLGALLQGTLGGTLPTGNFGSGVDKHFDWMNRHFPDIPLICMEFWVGWFDAWGNPGPNKREPEDVAAELRRLLHRGHANIYMFHGGTNFGFTSGANHYEKHSPDITSYDYDAPLKEDGRVTPKYEALKNAIADFEPIRPVEFSTEIRHRRFPDIVVVAQVSLPGILDSLASPIIRDRAYAMEDLDQGFGYLWYRVDIPPGVALETIRLMNTADRAQVFLDGKPTAVLEHDGLLRDLKIKETRVKTVDILVENQGRVNFGHHMDDQRKGIDGGLLVNGCALGPVRHYGLPLDEPPSIDWEQTYAADGSPSFHRFVLHCDAKDGFDDSYLDMSGWGKGVVFVNGYNLGRFWSIGPQLSLYLPGAFLKDGPNDIVVFETEGSVSDMLGFSDGPFEGRQGGGLRYNSGVDRDKPVTIYDIASLAGVSSATVSRVLTGSARVKPDKEQRILQIMEELNYTPNLMARNLQTQETKTIGVVLPDISSPFYSEFFLEAEGYAMSQGYILFLCNTMNNALPDKDVELLYLRQLLERRVDGILLLGGRINERNLDESGRQDLESILSQVPSILVNGCFGDDHSRIVRTDERGGFIALLEHLIELGHKDIALIGGTRGQTPTDLKHRAFRDTLKKHGLSANPNYFLTHGYSIQDGEDLISKLLENPKLPTACMCMNDTVAIGALKVLHDRGLSVPGDISITGFDNTILSEHYVPPITTVSHDFRALAHRSVDALLNLIAGKPVAKVSELPMSLVVRKTTGPPR